MKINNIICILLLAFIGCSSTVKNENDSSRNESNKVDILRFDKDFYSYLESPSAEREDSLIRKYPTLLNAFGLSVINTTMEGDKNNFFPTLQRYFSHPMLKNIYKESSFNIFSNVAEYENRLGEVNTELHKHFPNNKKPKFAMHVSGFKTNVVVLEGVISLSCDKYLGSDNQLYKEFFKTYQLQQMAPRFIVRDYLRAWLISETSQKYEKEDLLTAMVAEGKTLYALSVLLPELSQDDLIGFTHQQTAWCKENEEKVWKQIVKGKQLFTTDRTIIQQYMEDAPYTSAISPESPGRVSAWIGWQIVNRYAKKTDATLSDIMVKDIQTILKDSKYNP